jgi:hypothetical protein
LLCDDCAGPTGWLVNRLPSDLWLAHHIASAVADRTGWLTVRFDSGARLEAGPDGHYENWELVGPNGILIVGLPSGGEPAVWGAVGT